MERMKGVCDFSCFMYLKKILRPSTKMSENFAALYQISVIFHSDLDKELRNFAKILLFFRSTHQQFSDSIGEWKG